MTVSSTSGTRALVLTVVVAAVLSACGGGGGGGSGSNGGGGGGGTGTTITGTGAAPSSGPGDTQDYFPHGTGDTWSYDVAAVNPDALMPAAIATNTVTGTKSVHGLNAAVFSMVDPTSSASAIDNYLAVSAGGVTDVGNNDTTDVIDNQIVPFVKLLFPASTGTQSSISGTNVPAGKTSDGTPITANITQTISNASVTDTIDTAIGTYSNVIRQVTTISGNATAGGQTFAISGTTTSWLAPGAGLVKESSFATVQGSPISQTFDVRSYKVAGVPHGLGPVLTLDANVNAGGINQTRPAVATDGTNFLVVNVTSTVSAGQTQQSYAGSIVKPDGSVVSRFAVTPSIVGASALLLGVAAAFDGSNYLVVYEQSDLAGNVSLQAVQVSPAGTVTVLNASPLVQFFIGDQEFALAFDGSQFLLVYSDNQMIHGQFIASATHQPAGAAFTLPPGMFSNHPAVAFDGTNYLVAWDNLQDLPSMPKGTYVALVSTAGAVLSAAPIPVFQLPTMVTSDNPGYPAVSFDGQDYLVAYRDSRGSVGDFGISANRVSTSGTVLDGPGGFLVGYSSYGFAGPPTVAWYAGLNRLLWEKRDFIAGSVVMLGASVTSGGRVANNGAEGLQLATIEDVSGQAASNIGANSHGALMVWLTDGFPRQLQCMPIFPP